MLRFIKNKKQHNKYYKTNSGSHGFVLIEILTALIISSIMLVGIIDEMHMILLKRQRINAEVNYLFLSINVISLFDEKGWSGPGIWNGIDNNISWELEAKDIAYGNDNSTSGLATNNKAKESFLLIELSVIINNYKKDIFNAVRIYKKNEKQN